MPIYMNVDGIFSKPGAQTYPGASALANRIRKAFPCGVGMLVIGEASKEMVRGGQASGGAQAILIGLLLPAVKKFDSGAHADIALLKGALAPTGQIGVLMGDGSVRPVAGAAGPAIRFDKFDWSYREGGVNDTTF